VQSLIIGGTPRPGTVNKFVPVEQPSRGSCGSAKFHSQAYDSMHGRFQIHGSAFNCQLGFDQVGEWLRVILVGRSTVPDLPIQLLN
jgi:hypothetical protein